MTPLSFPPITKQIYFLFSQAQEWQDFYKVLGLFLFLLFQLLTVMSIQVNIENLMQGLSVTPHNSLQTPIKKGKLGFFSNVKTAETPNQQPSASKKSISDIQAEYLITNFHKIITIAESDEIYEETEIYRKLNFGDEKTKLNFQDSNSKDQSPGQSSTVEIKQLKVNTIGNKQNEQLQDNRREEVMFEDSEDGEDLEENREEKKTLIFGRFMLTPLSKAKRTMGIGNAPKKILEQTMQVKRKLF